LLYLAWLLCVQAGEVPGGEAEPPVPTALGRIKGSLQGLAEFLRIDPDLLASAGRPTRTLRTLWVRWPMPSDDPGGREGHRWRPASSR